MPLPFEFDFKNPDYSRVFNYRAARLKKIRQNPHLIPKLKKFYRDDPVQFIIDWGMTYDPRTVSKGYPAAIPFLLFPQQEEWCRWFLERWKNDQNGLTDKSREVGVTWLTAAMGATLCLHYDGLTGGYGSRKEDIVDCTGDTSTIFYKARMFLRFLPVEFRGGWNEQKNSKYMLIEIPETKSVMVGEGGVNLGRGKRYSFYFLDEAAHVLQPKIIDAALSESTTCKIDVSTPKGRNNPFADKRFSGNVEVFTLHWRDDPRKDEAWYEKRKLMIGDPVIIAQELDLDYSASVEGVVIPAVWVRAAVDAHKILGIEPKGVRIAALDVADQGKDLNAFCGRYGVVIEFIEEWTGKESDLFVTAERAFRLCDVFDYASVNFDSDGVGAGIRAAARVINDRRVMTKNRRVEFSVFHGSGKVIDPDDDPFHKKGTPKNVGKGRTNGDFFSNYKAQAWWSLRTRFELTYRVVESVKKGAPIEYDPEDIISISSNLTDSKGSNLLEKLIAELSQPTMEEDKAGKILIEKLPNGARSPNLADAVMMAFAPVKKSRGFFSVSQALI